MEVALREPPLGEEGPENENRVVAAEKGLFEIEAGKNPGPRRREIGSGGPLAWGVHGKFRVALQRPRHRLPERQRLLGRQRQRTQQGEQDSDPNVLHAFAPNSHMPLPEMKRYAIDRTARPIADASFSPRLRRRTRIERMMVQAL